MWYLTLHSWTGDPAVADRKLDEHLNWMRAQQQEGQVIASGPTMDGELGIIVFRGMPREELDALCRTEPFVRDGDRTYTVHAWNVHQILGAGPFSKKAVEAVTKSTAGDINRR